MICFACTLSFQDSRNNEVQLGSLQVQLNQAHQDYCAHDYSVPDSRMPHKYLLAVPTAHQVFPYTIIMQFFAHKQHTFIISLVYTTQEDLRTETCQVKSHTMQKILNKNPVSIDDNIFELITQQQEKLGIRLFDDPLHYILGTCVHFKIAATDHPSFNQCFFNTSRSFGIRH